MAKGQTGKASKRNVNVNVACGDRKMVFLLGLTAIMFTLSMVFIAKALYPRGVPVSFPGADCTVYDQELEQCSRKQTVATVALKKTINDLVTCKAGTFWKIPPSPHPSGEVPGPAHFRRALAPLSSLYTHPPPV